MKIYGGEGGIAFEGKRCNWAETGGETSAPGARGIKKFSAMHSCTELAAQHIFFH